MYNMETCIFILRFAYNYMHQCFVFLIFILIYDVYHSNFVLMTFKWLFGDGKGNLHVKIWEMSMHNKKHNC